VQRFLRAVERMLWDGRLLIGIAVVGSLVVFLAVLTLTTVDVVALVGKVLSYLRVGLAEGERDDLRLKAISMVVGIVDGYLLAGVLFIFALGLYELFIDKIEVAEGSEFARRLLLVRNLDDLKNRLARVVFLILLVKFLQLALEADYSDPRDLLYLAGGAALLAGALFLGGLHLGPRGKGAAGPSADDSAQ